MLKMAKKNKFKVESEACISVLISDRGEIIWSLKTLLASFYPLLAMYLTPVVLFFLLKLSIFMISGKK